MCTYGEKICPECEEEYLQPDDAVWYDESLGSEGVYCPMCGEAFLVTYEITHILRMEENGKGSHKERTLRSAEAAYELAKHHLDRLRLET